MTTVQTPSIEAQVAAERFARRVTARLSAGSNELPYDISERLRAARMQAIAQRKMPVALLRQAPSIVSSGGVAMLGRGGEGGGWLNALLSSIPLLALVAGLVAINIAQDEQNTTDVAELDAALLTDDLPPSAYADPGFVQFLKASASQGR
ncbi:MAG: DUF3619 family protein [Acidovorax sp.]|jgi:hypothetical protein